MIDVGSGPAIVLIPGIQGRWEWMRPAVNALAAEWRVLARSLPGEPGEPRDSGDSFDPLVAHIDRLLDDAAISRAVICGLSFGGLIALRYAATRPERVRALILVSAPGPRWRPSLRQAGQMQRPVSSLPLFLAGAVARSWRELRITFPDLRQRLWFCVTWALAIIAAPGIPWRMGSRARLAAAANFQDDCSRITAPTLVIAGEKDLDQVVSVDDTMEYIRCIPGAQFRLLERTGHLGTVSAPDRFASIVSDFLGHLSD